MRSPALTLLFFALALPAFCWYLAGLAGLAPRRSSRGSRAAVCCKAQAGDDDPAGLRRVASENAEVLPQSYFEGLDYGTASVPWDLQGRPQPPVRNAAREQAFGPAGTAILDCGSGSGDNANWLAAHGYHVLGFDFSPSAVATARQRSQGTSAADAIVDAGGAAEFVEASAVDLAASDALRERARELGGFPVALDSALLHCLDDGSQRRYLDGLWPLVRPGGRLFVGCFSDANPDPWSNPRRMSKEGLRALLTEEHGWRVVSIEEVWYERPAERSASAGGAWTMAWWCTAERLVAPAGGPLALASPAGALTIRTPPPLAARSDLWPTVDTAPREVVEAQLDALRSGNISRTFELLSRARRFLIEEEARRAGRDARVPLELCHKKLASMLERDCPGLVGHTSSKIVASFGDPMPKAGLLKQWYVRVKVDDGSRHFVFTLTQQSGYDGGDPRDCDGYERCWFVWSIRRDAGGDDEAIEPAAPAPADRLPIVA